MTDNKKILPTYQPSSLAVQSKEVANHNANLYNLIPEGGEYEQTYTLRRINLEPISITGKMRNAILQAMSEGSRFAQIGEFTIMLNSISSIEPRKLKIKPLSSLVKQLSSDNGGAK